MPMLDLLTQSYPSKALDQNQATLINMYLEADQSKGKYKVIALPTPGLTTFCDTGEANVRALYEHNGVLYAIAGDNMYSINSGGTATQIGTSLNTSSGFAKIRAITGGSDNNNQLIAIDGVKGYHYNIGTSTATFPIADVDFPQTCVDLETQDDYFFVVDPNSMSFNISAVANGLSWDALDFASKIGQADRLVSIISNARKIWLMGTKTLEPWYNSGNTDFPFERIPDTFLNVGCESKESVAISNTDVFFLGKNVNGGTSVIRITQYSPQPVSTQPLDTLFSTFTTSNATAICYKKDGHEFYEITFPTDARTFAYDITTGLWIERTSYISSAYTRQLASCRAFCYNKSLVGDYSSGKIYYHNTAAYTENSAPIKRTFISPPIYYEGKRVLLDKLIIDVETGIGSSKTFLLEKSFDSGTTWTTVDTFTVPEKGGRVYAHSLGSSQTGIMLRITTTMDGKFILLGFQAEVSVAHH